MVQIRADEDSDTVLAQFATLILNAEGGEWEFSLTPAQTTNLEAGVYFYDVQRTYPGDTVHTRFQGEAIVENDISHA